MAETKDIIITDETTGNAVIAPGLRADIMRKSMETKNELTQSGSLYVGTGEKETITVGTESAEVYKTKALNPPTEASNHLLTWNATGKVLEWATGFAFASATVAAAPTSDTDVARKTDLSSALKHNYEFLDLSFQKDKTKFGTAAPGLYIVQCHNHATGEQIAFSAQNPEGTQTVSGISWALLLKTAAMAGETVVSFDSFVILQLVDDPTPQILTATALSSSEHADTLLVGFAAQDTTNSEFILRRLSLGLF